MSKSETILLTLILAFAVFAFIGPYILGGSPPTDDYPRPTSYTLRQEPNSRNYTVTVGWSDGTKQTLKGQQDTSSPSGASAQNSGQEPFFEINDVDVEIENLTFEPPFESLLDAIEWEESKGKTDAVGDWTEWKEIDFDGSVAGSSIIGEHPKITQIKIGDNGKYFRRDALAVGSFQLHKVYVRDCNKIMRSAGIWEGEANPFTYEDRWNKNLSRAMTGIYVMHYRDKMILSLDAYDTANDFEAMSRIHNAGPDGWRNDPDWFVRNRGYTRDRAEKKIANAKAYWLRVKKELEK